MFLDFPTSFNAVVNLGHNGAGKTAPDTPRLATGPPDAHQSTFQTYKTQHDHVYALLPKFGTLTDSGDVAWTGTLPSPTQVDKSSAHLH